MKNIAASNKTHIQNRVYELKCKINYVESVCNTYKGKNNFFYQTNLIYLDELKQQLMDLKKS